MNQQRNNAFLVIALILIAVQAICITITSWRVGDLIIRVEALEKERNQK